MSNQQHTPAKLDIDDFINFEGKYLDRTSEVRYPSQPKQKVNHNSNEINTDQLEQELDDTF